MLLYFKQKKSFELLSIAIINIFLQCFEAVGWAAGRASGV